MMNLSLKNAVTEYQDNFMQQIWKERLYLKKTWMNLGIFKQQTESQNEEH